MLQNPSTRQEIQSLVQSGNEDMLRSLLGSRMEFGTAGKSDFIKKFRVNDAAAVASSFCFEGIFSFDHYVVGLPRVDCNLWL